MTCKCLGAFGRRVELSGSRRRVLVERRDDPWLVQTVRATWDRGPDQLRRGGERELFERRARRRIEAFVGATRRRSTCQVAPLSNRKSASFTKPSGTDRALHSSGAGSITSRTPSAQTRQVEAARAFIEQRRQPSNPGRQLSRRCSRTRCIRPMRRGLPPAGQPTREAAINKPAGASGSISRRVSISRPARPGRSRSKP